MISRWEGGNMNTPLFCWVQRQTERKMQPKKFMASLTSYLDFLVSFTLKKKNRKSIGQPVSRS